MTGNLALAWSKLFFRGLAAAGVRHVVVSPGSRSTPLALAAAETEGLAITVSIDERAAAFVALGMARATGNPAAVVATSGSAIAHWHPAIVEANEAFLPLIAVSADRPWEAHGCGSAQTIEQARLFGGHVRAAFDLGVPEGSADALRAVRRIAARAVATALGPTPGPVQVNAAFRKPLEPSASASAEPWEPEVRAAAALGHPRVHAAGLQPSSEAMDSVARAMRRARRAVIVAGPAFGARTIDGAALARLAEASGASLVVEATSGTRFSPAGGRALGALDGILRAGGAAEPPDFVLQIGAAPVSTVLGEWLARGEGPRIVATPYGWPDPTGRATEMVFGDPDALVAGVAERLGTRPEPVDAAWHAQLDGAEREAWRVVDAMCAGPDLREPFVARAAVGSVPEGWIAVSNSRPVRDLDSFVAPSTRNVRVLHQRGAAGIDGLIAGAVGAARATASPGVLLLGDVAALHDVGSLALAREVASPLAIVVVDNGGGRIFDELPIGRTGELDDARARLFTTAPRLDLAHAAAAFGLPFAEAATPAGLETALREAMARGGATVIAARVGAEDAPPRRQLVARLAAALAGGQG